MILGQFFQRSRQGGTCPLGAPPLDPRLHTLKHVHTETHHITTYNPIGYVLHTTPDTSTTHTIPHTYHRHTHTYYTGLHTHSHITHTIIVHIGLHVYHTCMQTPHHIHAPHTHFLDTTYQGWRSRGGLRGL